MVGAFNWGVNFFKMTQLNSVKIEKLLLIEKHIQFKQELKQMGEDMSRSFSIHFHS